MRIIDEGNVCLAWRISHGICWGLTTVPIKETLLDIWNWLKREKESGQKRGVAREALHYSGYIGFFWRFLGRDTRGTRRLLRRPSHSARLRWNWCSAPWRETGEGRRGLDQPRWKPCTARTWRDALKLQQSLHTVLARSILAGHFCFTLTSVRSFIKPTESSRPGQTRGEILIGASSRFNSNYHDETFRYLVNVFRGTLNARELSGINEPAFCFNWWISLNKSCLSICLFVWLQVKTCSRS